MALEDDESPPAMSPAELFLLTALSAVPGGQEQRVLVAIGRDTRQGIEEVAASGDDEAVVFLDGHKEITYSALRTAAEKLEKRYPGLKVEKDKDGFQGRSVWSLSYEGSLIPNGELGWGLPTTIATGATPEALRALDGDRRSSAGASGEESEPEGRRRRGRHEGVRAAWLLSG